MPHKPQLVQSPKTPEPYKQTYGDEDTPNYELTPASHLQQSPPSQFNNDDEAETKLAQEVQTLYEQMTVDILQST